MGTVLWTSLTQPQGFKCLFLGLSHWFLWSCSNSHPGLMHGSGSMSGSTDWFLDSSSRDPSSQVSEISALGAPQTKQKQISIQHCSSPWTLILCGSSNMADSFFPRAFAHALSPRADFPSPHSQPQSLLDKFLIILLVWAWMFLKEAFLQEIFWDDHPHPRLSALVIYFCSHVSAFCISYQTFKEIIRSAMICSRSVSLNNGFTHYYIPQIPRTMADSEFVE